MSQVHVRLNPTELEHLKAIAQACDLPGSTVLRVLLRGARPGDISSPTLLRRQRLEVRDVDFREKSDFLE